MQNSTQLNPEFSAGATGSGVRIAYVGFDVQKLSISLAGLCEGKFIFAVPDSAMGSGDHGLGGVQRHLDGLLSAAELQALQSTASFSQPRDLRISDAIH
ncbi:MAG: hypothetical protein U0931_11755 [Vulcanimicrobiota bacterium]